MTYEFMKQIVVAGAFGMIVSLSIWSFGYWIVSLVKWISRKVKKRKA